MNKKLLNKVMKKLASSNVVISPTVKSSSTSLSMQKKPETEQVQQKLEQYLLSRYHFRFNLLTEQTECCKKDADTPIYKVISQRTLNSLCLEARARHINCWDKDVSRFVNSEQMPDYHPLLSYMNTLPEWDGKDRVTPLAQRISTKDFWVNSFHRWMLGVTAQWSGRMDRCANAVAPMLVSSEQGRCKSTLGDGVELISSDGVGIGYFFFHKSFVHQGFEAYNKLLHTEWFFQIVISSQFKSFYYIIDGRPGGEE